MKMNSTTANTAARQLTHSNTGIPDSDIEKIADEIIAHGCNADGMLPSIPLIGRDGIVKVLNMAK